MNVSFARMGIPFDIESSRYDGELSSVAKCAPNVERRFKAEGM